MDPTTIAQQAGLLLLPYLPKLLDSASTELGKSVPKAVGSLWSLLSSRLQTKPAAQEAVKDAGKPDADDLTKAALIAQLRKLLAEDPELLKEVTALLSQAAEETPPSVSQSATARERGISVQIGGSSSGSITNITGDRRNPDNDTPDE